MHRTERISSIGQVVPILEAVSQIQDGHQLAFFVISHFFQIRIFKCDTCFIPFFGVENLILVFK